MQDVVPGGIAIVADDHGFIRALVQTSLGVAWSVYHVGDGAEAVEYARKTRASLVILDLKMTPMDGFEACTQIRRLAGYAHTPLVILTAYDTPANRRRASDAGADAVITKPFTTTELRSVVHQVITTKYRLSYQSQPQSEPQDILNVHRKVEVARRRMPYDHYTEWVKANRKDWTR